MDSAIFLSHLLDESTPGFGGAQSFKKQSDSRIRNGNSSNSQFWSHSNHIGTHIDFPLHFDDDGRSLSDYPNSTDWVFNCPLLIDIGANPDQLINSEDVVPKLISGTDLILLRPVLKSVEAKNPTGRTIQEFSRKLGLR